MVLARLMIRDFATAVINNDFRPQPITTYLGKIVFGLVVVGSNLQSVHSCPMLLFNLHNYL